MKKGDKENVKYIFDTEQNNCMHIIQEVENSARAFYRIFIQSVVTFDGV